MLITLLLAALTFALPTDVVFDELAPMTKGPAAISKFPTALQNVDLVNSMIAVADINLINAYMIRLTQFPERWYQSDNGLASALWIKDQITALQPLVSPDVVLSVNLFNHTWKQPSVIARLEAKNPNGAPGDIVITGSHFDTSAQGSPQGDSGPNPAADDDASGIAVVHETIRVMVKQKFVPFRPIEFHFYAAEEVGLYGSNAVAEAYAVKGVNVFNYLNLDQSGYVAPALKKTKPEIGIFTDYVTKDATAFARLTVNKYTSAGAGGMTVKESKCGYACTDNASWYKRGYNSALVFESSIDNATPYNDRVNSDGTFLDTMDTIDLPHVLEFAKHTIGFMTELSLAK